MAIGPMRNVLALLVPFVAAACASAAATSEAPPAPPLLLRDVTIVDVESGALLPDRDVAIRSGRIDAIAATGSSAIPRDAVVIDAAGAFLIPGLWDCHAHALKADRFERTRRLLLGNGITGFRDPNTSRPFDEIRALREEIAAGRLLAPRFVTSGPLIDGPQPIFEQFWSVATPEEARAAVVRLDEGGMDFVKVYTRLPRDCFFAIADEARKRGLPLAGHVPLELPAAEASDAGMEFIEHSFRHRMDACTAEAEIRGKLREQVDAEVEGDFARLYRLEQETFRLGIESYDPEVAAELGRRFARNGTWFTPTLVEGLSRYREEVLAADDSALAKLFEEPRLGTVPPAEWRRWLQQMAQDRGWFFGRVDLAGDDEETIRRDWRQERANRIRMVGDLHRGGARILAGTDAADNFPFVFFGSSLHDELELLAQAGLTPLEVLQSATLLPAVALHLEAELGTVAIGKDADLVLLDADPLDDVRNLARIRAVIRGGRWLDRAALDQLLVEAAAEARR
ncbi:MAG: amidohydrolase family protein [Planctomycetes bacterium]|nr:amidohydrolase family protein [Planctomycetota bacterium]